MRTNLLEIKFRGEEGEAREGERERGEREARGEGAAFWEGGLVGRREE